MRAEIDYADGDCFALRFPYHASLVRRVRGLNNRRWNKDQKRWEVHVSHLADVMRMFNIERPAISPKLWRAYQIHRIRNYRMRIVAGNVAARLSGDGIPFDNIDAATSFYVPGYQYMPRYIEGKWDGKRHLFDRRKFTFPAGLVSRVRALLQKEGVEHEFLNEADLPEPSLNLRKPGFELRDYQQECVDAALDARRGILELATGSGKTALATHIIHELGLPALFFVHTRDLLHQTREVMQEHLGVAIGQVGDGVINLEPVTVATIQTCAKALGIKVEKADDDEQLEDDKTDFRPRQEELMEFIRTCPVVFFDECHHLPADCCYSVALQTHGACYRYGLSATPYRSDRQDMLLEAALGEKLYRANASVLIEQGFLVAPKITFHAVPAYRKAPSQQPDYQTVFSEYIVKNPKRNSMIVEQARALAKKEKSVLVLVSQVAHGEALVKLMPEAALVQGSDPSEKRRRVFRKLEKKKQLIVVATTLADEGLDIPTLDAVILASGGKSESRALQRIGRALRIAPGKKAAIVVDFLDNAPFLGDHSMRRIEIFRSEPKFKVEAKGFTL